MSSKTLFIRSKKFFAWYDCPQEVGRYRKDRKKKNKASRTARKKNRRITKGKHT